MKIKKNVAISENGLLFHPETGESYSLNPIGMEILRALQKGKAFDDIREEVLAVYATDADTFERDYHDFIGMLQHHGLITTDDE